MVKLTELYKELKIKASYQAWKDSVLLCFDEKIDYIIDKDKEIYLTKETAEELRRLERLAARNQAIENIEKYLDSDKRKKKKHNFFGVIFKLIALPKDARQYAYKDINNLFEIYKK